MNLNTYITSYYTWNLSVTINSGTNWGKYKEMEIPRISSCFLLYKTKANISSLNCLIQDIFLSMLGDSSWYLKDIVQSPKQATHYWTHCTVYTVALTTVFCKLCAPYSVVSGSIWGDCLWFGSNIGHPTTLQHYHIITLGKNLLLPQERKLIEMAKHIEIGLR